MCADVHTLSLFCLCLFVQDDGGSDAEMAGSPQDSPAEGAAAAANMDQSSSETVAAAQQQQQSDAATAAAEGDAGGGGPAVVPPTAAEAAGPHYPGHPPGASLAPLAAAAAAGSNGGGGRGSSDGSRGRSRQGMLSESEASHILGSQANLWTEYVADEATVEYMLLPRLAALAEAVW